MFQDLVQVRFEVQEAEALVAEVQVEAVALDVEDADKFQFKI